MGTALPGEPVDNEALSSRLGIASEWVETFIGTRTRHFAVDLEGGHVRWTLEDLCTDAADRALADAGVEPDDIGFLVLATATPDALMPTTAALLADRLGIGGTPAYQLQSGCSGAVQALALARALLAEGTGGGGPGLVVGGTCAPNTSTCGRTSMRLPPGALVNYVLFGDGAGAALVGAAPGPVPGPHSPTSRTASTGWDCRRGSAWSGSAPPTWSPTGPPPPRTTRRSKTGCPSWPSRCATSCSTRAAGRPTASTISFRRSSTAG